LSFQTKCCVVFKYVWNIDPDLTYKLTLHIMFKDKFIEWYARHSGEKTIPFCSRNFYIFTYIFCSLTPPYADVLHGQLMNANSIVGDQIFTYDYYLSMCVRQKQDVANIVADPCSNMQEKCHNRHVLRFRNATKFGQRIKQYHENSNYTVV
jgi:hypothetical protein